MGASDFDRTLDVSVCENVRSVRDWAAADEGGDVRLEEDVGGWLEG